MGNAGSPPDGYAGDPPNNRYCTSCHAGVLNGGPGYVVIRGLPTTYSPGDTFYLSVVVYDTSKQRYGCEMVAKDTLGNVVGSFLTNGPNTQVSYAGYAKHQNAPYATDSFAFGFKYVAPTDYNGPIIFYAVGNAADGNGQNTNDNVYATVDTVHSTVSIAERYREVGVEFVGNSVLIRGRGEFFEVSLYTLNGRRVALFSGIVFGRRRVDVKGRGVVLVRSGRRVWVFKSI